MTTRSYWRRGPIAHQHEHLHKSPGVDKLKQSIIEIGLMVAALPNLRGSTRIDVHNITVEQLINRLNTT